MLMNVAPEGLVPLAVGLGQLVGVEDHLLDAHEPALDPAVIAVHAEQQPLRLVGGGLGVEHDHGPGLVGALLDAPFRASGPGCRLGRFGVGAQGDVERFGCHSRNGYLCVAGAPGRHRRRDIEGRAVRFS